MPSNKDMSGAEDFGQHRSGTSATRKQPQSHVHEDRGAALRPPSPTPPPTPRPSCWIDTAENCVLLPRGIGLPLPLLSTSPAEVP